MKVCIIVGTRPEIIKMSPIIEECKNRRINFFILHSNQHYSQKMDAIFFQELGLPKAKYNLSVGSGTHPNQIGNMLIKIEPILTKERPNVVLVQGDTNTVVAGSLAANKLSIPLGHVEAGLRSYDRTMPEETNRIIADHLSDYLFAVSKTQKEILEGEGINTLKIHTVGNTVVDAVMRNKEISKKKSTILSKLKIKPQEYALFTAHRVSNVDDKRSLIEVLDILDTVKLPVCWPIHLRAKYYLDKYKLSIPSNVILCEPLGYHDFLNLEQYAHCVITDSGGIQEEACILGVPCITIRDNTERPETIHVGANVLVGRDVDKLQKALKRPRKRWTNPFGNGNSAIKILDIICEGFSCERQNA